MVGEAVVTGAERADDAGTRSEFVQSRVSREQTMRARSRIWPQEEMNDRSRVPVDAIK